MEGVVAHEGERRHRFPCLRPHHERHTVDSRVLSNVHDLTLVDHLIKRDASRASITGGDKDVLLCPLRGEQVLGWGEIERRSCV